MHRWHAVREPLGSSPFQSLRLASAPAHTGARPLIARLQIRAASTGEIVALFEHGRAAGDILGRALLGMVRRARGVRLSTLSLRARVFAGVLGLLVSFANAQTGGLIGEPPDLSNWPHPAAPIGNPFPRSTAPPAELAQRDAAVRLGKVLFWDEQVSIDNTMACGTCHLTELGGTDGRLGAVFTGGGANNGNFGSFGVVPQGDGVNNFPYGHAGSAQITRLVTPVHTPTMIGAYMFNNQFWDMRAGPGFSQTDATNLPFFPNFTANASLEDQAVGPPISDVEMSHQTIQWTDGTLQTKLNNSRPLALVDPATIPPDIRPLITTNYRIIFNDVYSGHAQFGGNVGVTRERFAMAIAHYTRTLIPDQAPIDLGTMTPNQQAGFKIMRPASASNPTGRGNCFFCHSDSGDAGNNPQLVAPGGPFVNPRDNLLSDGLFHDINVTPSSPSRKTTSLRNVGLHRKFFSTGHGGNGVSKITVSNLDELITFYDNQTGADAFFGFTGTLNASERAAVKDFLENALTDPRVRNRQFPFDRPELASERADFNPFEGNEYGTGTAGPSALVPEIIANAPPLAFKLAVTPSFRPRSWFKVGVGNAPPNANATLMFSGTAAAGPVLWVGPQITNVNAGTTNAQGIATAFTPFPINPSVVNVPVFVQWTIADGAGAAFSDAARFVPFM
jgi:cytochrome c peroxidase